MNRKQYGKRKKLRKRKIKRLMIAYLLRAIVILIPIIMMILMVCGCLYIYERFTKEDEKVNKYTDYTQIETQATMLLLLLQQRIMPGVLCCRGCRAWRK